MFTGQVGTVGVTEGAVESLKGALSYNDYSGILSPTHAELLRAAYHIALGSPRGPM